MTKLDASIIEGASFPGHDLWSWDEDDDWETWGGDYVRPQRTRMIIKFRYPAPHDATVDVTFGPWPGRDRETAD
jgi:hypothetical protein